MRLGHALQVFLATWTRRLADLRPVRSDRETAVRPVALGEDLRLPFYLQTEGSRLGLEGEVLRATVGDEPVASAPLAEVAEVVLLGPVGVTTPCLHALLRADVPVAWHSASGWFLGHTMGLGVGRLALRLAQVRASEDAAQALGIARRLVQAKIVGCRVLVRRLHKGPLPPRLVLCRLDQLATEAERAGSLNELLGIEGSAAAAYFGVFKDLLSPRWGAAFAAAFPGRRRRPPTDPLNAALSFAYAMLVRAMTVAAQAAGLDPQLGFLHQPRAGQPALALDLIEPLRPLVADSVVLDLINHGRLAPEHFACDADEGVRLEAEGRKRLIAGFEARLSQELEHPLFARPIAWRDWIRTSPRLLGDHLAGIRPDFPLPRPR